MNSASALFFSIQLFFIDIESEEAVFVLHSNKKLSIMTSPFAKAVAPEFAYFLPLKSFATVFSCLLEKYLVGLSSIKDFFLFL